MDLLGMLLSVLFVSGASADCPMKPDLFITAPKKMEALSGSCLMIPCNFRPNPEEGFSSTREIFGVWIKNDSRFGPNPNNVIFNSSGTVNINPMKITGNLREKNCTTVFSNLTTTHTDTYYFRIENEPFKATASCDSLQITVKDSAPRPIIKIPGDLKEKESVTITCSALTPCPHSPPKLTWTLQQDPHTNIVNTNGTFTTKIQETITLSDRHDGSTISCSATYPVNGGRDVRTAETQETLRVSYAPKDTSASISPSGLVSAGTWVNLSCSSRARPPVSSFTWFKSSKDGARTVSEGAFYSFNATQRGVYYCVAANDLGNQTSAQIRLSIGGTHPGALAGGLIVVFVLICVVVAIWWLKYKHRSTQTEFSQSPNDPAPQQPETTTGEETVHYGEINFSSPRPEPRSHLVQDQGQDTLYAQVKVSERTNILTQTSDGPENLYAEVKKK
ncbi:sialic acid-binding Ig-like lectin 13 isoform X1 [Channa argus]|uniref:sialic acid-binding Ig-like lectin 13 isoform X1 n=1 Tax=Channa argus TaxID=215402 RepID=UPI00352197E4